VKTTFMRNNGNCVSMAAA